jgi:hypothetical protein
MQQHVEQSDALNRAAFKPGGTTSTTSSALVKKTNTPPSRKLIDKFCDACGGYGHGWSRCDFTAKLAKSLDFLAGLGTKKKQSLTDNYIAEQTKCRDRRQTSLTGKAQALYDAGNMDGLYNLVVQGDEASDVESSE